MGGDVHRVAVDLFLPASAEAVFRVLEDHRLKEHWYIGHSGIVGQLRELDFRVGGREVVVMRFGDADVVIRTRFTALAPARWLGGVSGFYQDDRVVSASDWRFDLRQDGPHCRLRHREDFKPLTPEETVERRSDLLTYFYTQLGLVARMAVLRTLPLQVDRKK